MTTILFHPSASDDWASVRETDPAVATAIHAIASDTRTPDQIWDDPTDDETAAVARLVGFYVRSGDYPASDDDTYCWGETQITVK